MSLSINGKPNGNYEYRILACSPYSKTQPLLCSAVSAPVAVQVAIPGGIVAPKNFNLGLNSQTYVGGNYSFEWSAVSAATSYKVCEYDTAGGVATTCKTVNGLSSVSQPFSHGLNEVLITFYYDVKACTASTCSVGSTSQYSVQITCPPSTPNCLPPRPNSTKEAGVISYIHTDQLGSPVAETNATGAMTTRFRYEPFGQSLESNPVQGPGYTGHVVDAASGLIYMQQRYYEPVLGRFLSTDPDPVNAVGTNFNRYAYVGNNPYRYVDPDGRAGSCDMCYFGGSLPAGTNGPAYAAAQAQLTPVAAIGIAAALTGPAIVAGIAEAGAGLAVAGSVAATGEIAGATQIAAAALTPAVETAAAIATDGVVGGAAVASAISNEAAVVRGGNAANQTAAKIAAAIGPSRTPGVTGFSAQCNGGTCLSTLGGQLRNGKIGVTTAGDIRAAGGDVVATPGLGNHVTVTGLSGEKASPLFKEVTNPNPKK